MGRGVAMARAAGAHSMFPIPPAEPAVDIGARVGRLIEGLLQKGLLSSVQLERGKRAAETSGERPDIVLNKLGLISDADLVRAYQDVTGLEALTSIEPGQLLASLPGIDPGFLRSARILPLQNEDGQIELALADPLDLRAVRALIVKAGREFPLRIAARTDIEAALSRLSQSGGGSEAAAAEAGAEVGSEDIERLKDIASEAPIIRLVSEIIENAVQKAASDVHITRSAEGGRVRLRLDGRLNDMRQLTPRVHQAVVSRLKIMAALDIGERRLPQDGRIQVATMGREIDLRISTMPHAHGEGAFIRVLDNKAAVLDLEGLGFSSEHTARIAGILGHAHGLFLITGPTGSGKTTTLYAALRHLNDPSKNIVTVEDPIEYTLTGINQIQVNRRAGLDFSRTLRSVLRQDPDVIMIGEIRDRETAAIAVQAALTGHFVLATLHTNDALSAIDRLIDMEVEPFLLASVLRGVMAQRLVRRLCPSCSSVRAKAEAVSGAVLNDACPACHGGGYAGRIPLAEVIPVGPELQRAVGQRLGADEMSGLSASLGFENLQADGERLVAAGMTTKAEIFRALGE
jgi:general secretion pathway protein E